MAIEVRQREQPNHYNCFSDSTSKTGRKKRSVLSCLEDALVIRVDSVIVKLEVPKEGPLQNLKTVRLNIGEGNAIVAANLEAKADENGNLTVHFQIDPEFVDICSIWLFVQDPDEAGNHYYAVQLEGYVTDKK